MESTNSNSLSPPKDDNSNLRKSIIESKQIIDSHRFHFFILTFIFFLLPWAATEAFLICLNDTDFNKTKTLLILLLLFIYNIISSTCGVGSITYTVFHSVKSQQKVNLKSAITSLATSFLPLLATTFLLHVINLAITAATLGTTFFLLTKLLGFDFDFDFDHASSQSLIFYNYIWLALVSFVTYIQADFSLAQAITFVGPTTWGFESLKLSKGLMVSTNGKGSRETAFFMSFCNGVIKAFALLYLYLPVVSGLRWSVTNGGGEKSYVSFIFPMLCSFMGSIFMSYFELRLIATNAVLYVRCCMACNVEQYGCEFPTEYVLVPSDDDDINQRVISVV